ncbi:MAG: CmcI family methyltransferase [Pseudomonadota bacterium]
MRITIDTDAGTFTTGGPDDKSEHELFSKEAFDIISDVWVKTGWVRKYSYGFSWLGRPIIQLPDDMVRIQEAIWQVKPDIIIETGIAHGGSLIFYASLLEMIGKGKVIGLDIDIRPANRQAIEAHPMFSRIEMIEGSSVAPEVVEQVRNAVKPGQAVMLILDSNHERDHVAAELDAYADLVTSGSYILSQDGVMKLVAGMPRSGADWADNNPISAVENFLQARDDFVLEKPPRPFDETSETPDCSHHPIGWIRRL